MNRIKSFVRGLSWLTIGSILVMLLGFILFFFPTLWGLWQTDYPKGSPEDLAVQKARKSKALLIAVAATIVVVAAILLSPIVAIVAAVAVVAAVVFVWDWFDADLAKKPKDGDSTGQGSAELSYYSKRDNQMDMKKQDFETIRIN